MSDAARKLPLHVRHEALGARFAPFAGYEMPMRYTTIKDEHACVRERVGVFDVSHMGEVFVRGADAVAAVDRIVTNDCSKLVDGKALYTVMCRPDGGIIDDLIVYRLGPEEMLLCVNAANRAKDFAWIADNLEGNAVATDESDAWVQLAVQGPRAVALVDGIADIDAASVGGFRAAWGMVAGARCLIARTGYTGEDGFELYVPADHAEPVFDAIMAAGEGDDIQAIGLGARDTLRLEAKLHLYGNDMDEETNPVEAGLSWTVKLDKGDFIGRDAIAEAKHAGPSRRLRGLVLEGRGVIRSGYAVKSTDGEPIGTTTSGGIAPSLEGVSIGLAYLAVEHCNDERVVVQIRNRDVPARVTRKPFYSRPRD